MQHHVVLSTCGARFPAYLGVLQEVQKEVAERGSRLASVTGVSGGSIVGLLLVLGYSLPSVHMLFTGLDYGDINSIDVANFMQGFGFESGDALCALLRDLIRRKLGNGDACFADLARSRGACFRVVATNLSAQRAQVFSAEDSPDVPLWLAVRASIAIPFVFTAVRHAGCVFTDGGILCPNPVCLLPAALVAPGDTVYYMKVRYERAASVDDIAEFTWALVSALTSNVGMNTVGCLGADDARIVCFEVALEVVSGCASAVQLMVDAESIEQMIRCGSGCAARVLEQHRSENVVADMVRGIMRRAVHAVV
jgi:hypothetical protein